MVRHWCAQLPTRLKSLMRAHLAVHMQAHAGVLTEVQGTLREVRSMLIPLSMQRAASAELQKAVPMFAERLPGRLIGRIGELHAVCEAMRLGALS